MYATKRADGQQARVGLVFGMVVEKNAELCLAEPVYKGRAVFQGNKVRDINGNLSGTLFLPAAMEAARCADAYGLLHGHTMQQSNAEQAYTQACLDGANTWVPFPRGQWPKEWWHLTDPVCPLRLALYGHPDSGGH